MMRISRVIFVAGASLIFALVVGCQGRESARDLTFAVGGAPNEVAFWEGLVKEFETATGTPVRIIRQPADTDQRRQGLVVPLRSGQTDPDVFLMDVAWLGQFAASGWLQPLDEFVQADDYHTGFFFKRVVELADRHGTNLIALPVNVDVGLLYYRRDLLERFGYARPPETWEELLAMSERVQKEIRSAEPRFFGYIWQGARYEGLICNFLEVAASNRGGFHVDAAGIRVDSPENRQALLFMHGLIHESGVSPPNTFTEMKEEEVRSQFENGLALFERNWPYAWALHNAPDSAIRGMVGIAPLPHFEGGESAGTLGGWHIGISDASDQKEAAWAFLKFAVSLDVQRRMVAGLGWNSARRDVYQDAELLEQQPHLVHLRGVMEHATPRPLVPYYTQLSEVLQSRINSALAGQDTPEEALRLAEEDLARVVKRYSGE